MKRMLWITLSMAVLLMLCCGAAQAEPWSGAGTEANPWKITSAADLVALREYVAASDNATDGKYFLQTQDISLSSICGPGLSDWTPIGIFEGAWSSDTHAGNGIYFFTEHTY